MTIEPLAPGSLLLAGSLEVQSVLGAGGFGVTYLCRHRLLSGEHRAVKELAPVGMCVRAPGQNTVRPTSSSVVDFEAVRRRFADEAGTLLSLSRQDTSSGIVRIHDVWEENGTVYYSMEHIAGAIPFPRVGDPTNLAGRWPIVEGLALQLLQALARLERARIVHGDLKPDNVLVTSRSGELELCLIDFGAARTQAQLQSTLSSTAWTVGYASLEWSVAALRSEIGPATDIYAWGIMVYGAMLRHPLAGAAAISAPVDAASRMALAVADPYATASTDLQRVGVPGPWADAVAAAIRLRAADRPNSPSTLLVALRQLGGDTVRAHPARPTSEQSRHTSVPAPPLASEVPGRPLHPVQQAASSPSSVTGARPPNQATLAFADDRPDAHGGHGGHGGHGAGQAGSESLPLVALALIGVAQTLVVFDIVLLGERFSYPAIVLAGALGLTAAAAERNLTRTVIATLALWTALMFFMSAVYYLDEVVLGRGGAAALATLIGWGVGSARVRRRRT